MSYFWQDLLWETGKTTLTFPLAGRELGPEELPLRPLETGRALTPRCKSQEARDGRDHRVEVRHSDDWLRLLSARGPRVFSSSIYSAHSTVYLGEGTQNSLHSKGSDQCNFGNFLSHLVGSSCHFSRTMSEIIQCWKTYMFARGNEFWWEQSPAAPPRLPSFLSRTHGPHGWTLELSRSRLQVPILLLLNVFCYIEVVSCTEHYKHFIQDQRPLYNCKPANHMYHMD